MTGHAFHGFLRAAPWAALAVSAVLLAACGAKEGDAPAGGGMPPPQVGVIKVQPASVPLVTELPGRLEASREAQVRARVAGIVHKRLFREGSDVKAGQALFQIDPATYQASVNSAKASLT